MMAPGRNIAMTTVATDGSGYMQKVGTKYIDRMSSGAAVIWHGDDKVTIYNSANLPNIVGRMLPISTHFKSTFSDPFANLVTWETGPVGEPARFTNSRGELLGLYLAIEMTHGIPGPITVHIDSKYAIGVAEKLAKYDGQLTKIDRKAPNRDLIEIISDSLVISGPGRYTFVHVRAHRANYVIDALEGDEQTLARLNKLADAYSDYHLFYPH